MAVFRIRVRASTEAGKTEFTFDEVGATSEIALLRAGFHVAGWVGVPEDVDEVYWGLPILVDILDGGRMMGVALAMTRDNQAASLLGRPEGTGNWAWRTCRLGIRGSVKTPFGIGGASCLPKWVIPGGLHREARAGGQGR